MRQTLHVKTPHTHGSATLLCSKIPLFSSTAKASVSTAQLARADENRIEEGNSTTCLCSAVPVCDGSFASNFTCLQTPEQNQTSEQNRTSEMMLAAMETLSQPQLGFLSATLYQNRNTQMQIGRHGLTHGQAPHSEYLCHCHSDVCSESKRCTRDHPHLHLHPFR